MRRPRDLATTSSLELGARGTYEGEPFTLAGRRCVAGERGQIWNEWSLKFENNAHPTLFLAESWGSFTLYRETSLLPPPEELIIGTTVTTPWLVVERGTAMRLAKWGDVDEAPETYDYVDLSLRAAVGSRATISEGQTWVGTQVTADVLGLALATAPPALIPAPDVSMPAGIELWLDVGDVGTLDGVEYRVLGIVARRTPREAEEEVRWEDYLLYNARVGQRWLSVADGHWSYVTPIEPGNAAYEMGGEAVGPLAGFVLGGREMLIQWAAGELPWAAEIGERAWVREARDVVFERSFHEISASRAQALSSDDVARAFDKRSLPRPR